MTWLRFVSILLNLVSALLTGLGIFGFLSEGIGAVVDETVYANRAALLLAGLATLSIQALVQVTWWRTGGAGFVKNPIGLVAGLVFSFASWFGGAAGMILVMNNVELLNEKRSAEAAAFVQPLRSFAADYSRISVDLARLATRAGDLAKREETGGGTCVDDTSPGGTCGPRCRLRQRQAERLAEQARTAERLADDAVTIGLEMELASSLEQGQELYRNASRLSGSSELAALRAALAQTARELTGPVQDAATGATFTCSDPAFAAELSRVEASSNTDIELPPPPTDQRVTLGDTGKVVGKRLVELLSGDAFGHESDPALAAAAALELIIILVIVMEASHRRRLGMLDIEEDDFGRHGRRLSPRELAIKRRLLKSLSLYKVSAGALGDYLAVPIDGSIEAREEAEEIVSYFDLRRPVSFECLVREVDPAWLRSRSDHFGGASLFTMYAMSDSIREWARKTKRDVEKSTPLENN